MRIALVLPWRSNLIWERFPVHESSYRHMRDLVERYLAGRTALRVADLGSQDVNGSYRPLFDRPGW